MKLNSLITDLPYEIYGKIYINADEGNMAYDTFINMFMNKYDKKMINQPIK